MRDNEEKPLRKREVPCREPTIQFERITAGKTPLYYNAFPRDCKFAYMTPGYFATGFRILDVYKTDVDFTEMRNLMFLEDSKQAHKWGHLRTRVPFPKTRVTDLPGTRLLKYENYCLRSLTPESAMSWRKSIKKKPRSDFEDEFADIVDKDDSESKFECGCRKCPYR